MLRSSDTPSLTSSPTPVSVAMPTGAVARRTVELYDGLVSIAIPADWAEIPPSDLEAFTLRLAETTGGQTAETYQHGLQHRNAPRLFAYPHVLVQIKETGRLSYGAFLSLPSVDEVQQTSSRRLVERGGPLVSGLSLDQLFFDRSRFALRMSSTIQTTTAGGVGVHSASFLTERGLFVVHCFDLISRFQLTAPLFARIVDSVAIRAPLAYQPRTLDRWPLLTRLDWRHAAVALVIAVLAAALVMRIRHARRGRDSGSVEA